MVASGPASVLLRPLEHGEVGDPEELERVLVHELELSSQVLAEMAHPGPPLHTELGEVEDLAYVDLPTGHWPMFSRPRDLADTIATAVTGAPLPG